ncbi:MAG: MFS transporter [Oscillospiraceae bacterium]|nr:MFS transporter [Oscillospiraceae bacterium]
MTQEKTDITASPLPPKEMRKVRLVYGLGDFYGGGAMGIVGLLYLFFLTNIAGISPLQAGLVVFIGGVFDAITDPLMGTISDRTRSKRGRRAPFFLWGVIPVVISFIFIWYVPALSGWWLVLYYIFVFCFFNGAFAIVMVPYAALAPELSPDAGQRTSIIGTRMAFSVFGALLAAVVPMLIIESIGGDVRVGYILMALLFALIFGAIWLLMYFVMRGREIAPAQKHPTKIGTSLKQMGKNKPFRILVAVYLLAFIPNDITGANFIYFLNFYLLREGYFSLVVGLTMVVAVLSLPFYIMLIKRWGKPKTMVVGCLLRTAGLLTLLLIGPETPLWLILAFSAFHGIGMGSSYAVPWALLPEVTDYDEALTGERNEGIYAGIMTFIRKLSSALAMLMIGAILQFSGYVGDAAVQSETAVTAIRMTTILLPLVCSLICAFAAARFPIGPHNLGKLRELVDARRRGEEVGDVEKMLERTK